MTAQQQMVQVISAYPQSQESISRKRKRVVLGLLFYDEAKPPDRPSMMCQAGQGLASHGFGL